MNVTRRMPALDFILQGPPQGSPVSWSAIGTLLVGVSDAWWKCLAMHPAEEADNETGII
jgi:hypothetical protein